ncbi:MAG: LOG family protein, partial [Proteobacteria bacterium]|nr:LOG family protein [Pseudomonadota bacterium]
MDDITHLDQGVVTELSLVELNFQTTSRFYHKAYRESDNLRICLLYCLRVANNILAKSHYYEEARKFSRLVSGQCQVDGKCDYVVVTGGGPGVMEAANRGAYDIGANTIGLNIVLPEEQAPNPYITPELCFKFHYFAIRKMHFMMRARALVGDLGGTDIRGITAAEGHLAGAISEINLVSVELDNTADIGAVSDGLTETLGWIDESGRGLRTIAANFLRL